MTASDMQGPAGSSPPPYSATLSTRGQPGRHDTRSFTYRYPANEQTGLLHSQNNTSRETPSTPPVPSKRPDKILARLISLFGIVAICWLVSQAMNAGTLPSVEERQRIRKAWAAEVAQHEKIRVGWKHEVKEHEALRREWDEAERRRREEEEAVRARFAWDGLAGDSYCLRYATRRYTARIANVPRSYDPVKACMETSVEIHGRRLTTPERCEDRGCEGVFGHWVVDFAEAACSPHFAKFDDKVNSTSIFTNKSLSMVNSLPSRVVQVQDPENEYRMESRLWDLRPGDDWREMCSTTPADLRGIHFDGPDMCENWGIQGVWARWDIEDSSCT
ncbi:hypothetical protein MKEN_00428200 [Mycena kentingensis (nom. inval.)]|nr:hypothetical protein MKEN_00428200 [Mycena kentingensis (nom. inval.)]